LAAQRVKAGGGQSLLLATDALGSLWRQVPRKIT
jgi:hypothetical protein